VTVSFAATLLQYFTTLPVGGVAPIFLLYAAGGFAFLRPNRGALLRHILGNGSVVFLFFVLFELVSYYSGWSYSIEYGLILIFLVLAIRLILLQVGFLRILRCYINSAIVCTLIIVVSGKQEISSYQVGQVNRFTAGSVAHPNLLGFTMASYLPLFIGMFLESKKTLKKSFMLGLVLAVLGVLFLAGSRGSLVAALGSLFILLARYTVITPLLSKLRVNAASVGLTLIGGVAAVGYLSKGTRIKGLVKFFNTALALDSKYRGIHSGFSGRTAIWLSFLHRITGLQWLFGFGFRQAYIVDNGYITLLFDNGLLGLVVFTAAIVRVGFWLWMSTNRPDSWDWWRYRLVLLALLMGYLINCISARYLLSYGNQYSLLVLFMVFSNKRDLLGMEAERSRVVNVKVDGNPERFMPPRSRAVPAS
jgi:hypothetical protein